MKAKLLTVAVLLMVSLAGCGSGSKRSTTSSGGAGSGNKTAFCTDNSKLDKATSSITSVDQVVPALKPVLATMNDFAKNAPGDIKPTADLLVNAASAAIKSNRGTPFTDPKVKAAGPTVDAYCGQQSNGDPISGSTSTTS